MDNVQLEKAWLGADFEWKKAWLEQNVSITSQAFATVYFSKILYYPNHHQNSCLNQYENWLFLKTYPQNVIPHVGAIELNVHDAVFGYFKNHHHYVTLALLDLIRMWRSARPNEIVLLTIFAKQEWYPAYHTTTTENLAKTIYETEKWELCPILADALMDAGCEEDHYVIWLLRHYWHNFARGAWVLEQLRNEPFFINNYAI